MGSMQIPIQDPLAEGRLKDWKGSQLEDVRVWCWRVVNKGVTPVAELCCSDGWASWKKEVKSVLVYSVRKQIVEVSISKHNTPLNGFRGYLEQNFTKMAFSIDHELVNTTVWIP